MSSEYFWDGKCAPLIDRKFDHFPIPFIDNSTVKLPGGREVYLIYNQTKCQIGGIETFNKLGLDFGDTVTIDHSEFNNIPSCRVNNLDSLIPISKLANNNLAN